MRRAKPAPFVMRAVLVSIATMLVSLGGAAGAAYAAGGKDKPEEPDSRPNVIVVVTDDQPVGAFNERFMPRTFEHFVEGGTEFTEGIVATPLCCPSRAALLTGQYGHNNGVLRNSYRLLEQPENVLPAWLGRAGYKTMHVGRFLNGYGFVGRKRRVAPGWKVWRTMLEPNGYFNYRMRFNNRFRDFGSAPGEYLTTNLNRISANLIRRHSGNRRPPFYMQIDHYAPHFGRGEGVAPCDGFSAIPAPRDAANPYGGEPLPQPPSYDEEDFSDKPEFMQGLPRISNGDNLTEKWRCQLGALREVDRGMGELWQALREEGELRNTAVIFTSDNGYLYGEHRLELDKHYAYEESLRVPFTVRLPRSDPDARQPPTSAAPVANIDLAPTILELAEAEPCIDEGCRTMDGRSLVSAASGQGGIPPERGIAIEYNGRVPKQGLVCEFQGIRTTEALRVEHVRTRLGNSGPCDGPPGVEAYDLLTDPFQLDNLAGGPTTDPAAAARQAELASRSRGLADCSGIRRRDPEPIGRNYCE